MLIHRPQYPLSSYAAPALVLALGVLPQCTGGNTTQDIKSGVNVGVQVSDLLCKELADAGSDPEWVKIACPAADVAGGLVNILLPRREWGSLRARHQDAGPGK